MSSTYPPLPPSGLMGSNSNSNSNNHDLSFSIDHGGDDGPYNNNNNNSNNGPYDGSMTMGQIAALTEGGRKPPGVLSLSSSSSTTSSSMSLQFVQDQLKQSSHPMVVIFHIVFKLLSLLVYIFGGWFVGGNGMEKGARFISVTVVCILLLAADFWVVKNVTGRLLVGLRWWNKVDEDGTTWIFESSEGKRPINPFDRNVFWLVLYGTPIIWTIFLLLALLKLALNWMLIVGMALTLSCANVYGYYKCSSEQKTRTQQMFQQYATQGAVAVMRSNLLAMLTGQQPMMNSSTTTTAAASGRGFV